MSSDRRKYELRVRAQRQAATRQRIVEATVALHQEVGPARTTVAEIARRAGVQRLTVYTHFPDDKQLFVACQQHFLSRHPPPDFTAALALDDPSARVYTALLALYASYRGREAMTSKVVRDRAMLPALDALLRETMDAQLNQLVGRLMKDLRPRTGQPTRLNAALRLAVDFWTWARLKSDGLDDEESATIMRALVIATAGDTTHAAQPRVNPP